MKKRSMEEKATRTMFLKMSGQANRTARHPVHHSISPPLTDTPFSASEERNQDAEQAEAVLIE